ncbi:MAG TPA: EAL domain-containing protein [Burkholderiales bacterium]|nr:EAL domain-containing protein [Burkholderiales bacterium]
MSAVLARETHLRRLAELSSSDWYWEQDEAGRFTQMSGRNLQRAGISPPELIGRTRWEIGARVSPSARAKLEATIADRQPFHDFGYSFIDAAGAEHHVETSGEPIFDSSGRFRGYRGIGRDVTERMRAERLLRLEHAVAQCFAEAGDAANALTSVLRTLCETQGWERGTYWHADDAADVLRFGEAWNARGAALQHYTEASRGVVFPPGVGLAGRAWQSGEPVWTADIGNDPRALQGALARETGMRGMFAFPIKSEGRTLGVLACFSRQLREPDTLLLSATQVIGSQIGQFLRRKQSDEALRASNEDLRRFRAAMDISADAITLVDRRSMRYIDANGTACRWLGYSREALCALGPQDVLPQSRKEIEREYDALIAGRPEAARFESTNRRSDGTTFPVEVLRCAIPTASGHTIVATIRDITERNRTQERLAFLSQFDAVTGLPNRSLFRDRLAQSLMQAERNGWNAAVLLIDLDRFRDVNDTCGVAAGDALLSAVGRRLSGCVRSGDTVARLGSDEFAVVLSKLGKADDASLVARKVIAAFEQPFELGGREAFISASFGIALYPSDGAEADVLLKQADTAMCRAKEEGGNSYRFFLPGMHQRSVERIELEHQLRGALERKEFVLQYQPKADLLSGALCGFEALLRWQHPQRGLVPPGEFIPLLEDTGLIVPVGEWVLRSACEQLALWRAQGLEPGPIAVNLSARQFEQEALDAVVGEILRDTNVEPALLELELTESMLMKNAERAAQTLGNLRRYGVRLSVDDFGTGYSSLAYLRRFPLDALKIDRTFIRDCVGNPEDATIALAIINLAHSLKLKVVAEGVETEAQLSFLRAHGCDQVQGFHFARPMDAADATHALRRELRLSVAGDDERVPAVLLVDDNSDDLQIFSDVLAADGYRILAAQNAKSALDLMAKHRVALVISDHNMPDMKGVRLLAALRNLYPRTVRAMLTGSDRPDTMPEAVNDAGVHKFLSKHWARGRLQGEVREAYRLGISRMGVDDERT